MNHLFPLNEEQRKKSMDYIWRMPFCDKLNNEVNQSKPKFSSGLKNTNETLVEKYLFYFKYASDYFKHVLYFKYTSVFKYDVWTKKSKMEQ